MTPRKKLFIKVDQHTYNNYLELLSIISNNIGITIKEYDSTYLNVDNYYLLSFLSGYKKLDNNIIYTNFKTLNVDQLEDINIIDNKLFNDIHQIVITKNIIMLIIY